MQRVLEPARPLTRRFDWLRFEWDSQPSSGARRRDRAPIGPPGQPASAREALPKEALPKEALPKVALPEMSHFAA